MRSIFLSLILIGSFASVVAQTTTKTELVPTPANDYLPERWKEFKLEGRFRVLFPDFPKESISRLALPAGEVLSSQC